MSLVTFLFLQGDTLTKAFYKGKHLIGGLTVPKGEPMTLMAGDTEAGRQALAQELTAHILSM